MNHYDKTLYTYTKEEVHVAGPYGKEKLNDHDTFVYIRHIQANDERTNMTI